MNKKILLGSILSVVILILVSFTSVVGYNSVESNNTSNDLPDIIITRIRPGLEWRPPGEPVFGLVCVIKNIGSASVGTNGFIRIKATAKHLDSSNRFVKYDTFIGDDYLFFGLAPGETSSVFFTYDESPWYTHPLGLISFKCSVHPGFEERTVLNNFFSKRFRHPHEKVWIPLIFWRINTLIWILLGKTN